MNIFNKEKILILKLSKFKDVKISKTNFHISKIDKIKELDKIYSVKDELNIDYKKKLYEYFISNGNICFVAKSMNEKVVGHIWTFKNEYILTSDDYKKTNLKIPLNIYQRFLGNGFIEKEYRLKGIFPILMKSIVNEYCTNTTFFTAIDKSNRNSFNSHKRLGFQEVGNVNSIRILSHYFYVQKNLQWFESQQNQNYQGS